MPSRLPRARITTTKSLQVWVASLSFRKAAILALTSHISVPPIHSSVLCLELYGSEHLHFIVTYGNKSDNFDWPCLSFCCNWTIWLQVKYLFSRNIHQKQRKLGARILDPIKFDSFLISLSLIFIFMIIPLPITQHQKISKQWWEKSQLNYII